MSLIEIFVKINDKKIIINILLISAVVPENVAIGIDVTKVTATDPDEGLGGEIKYEFLDEGEANGKFLQF